jgi:hypothetical protein
MTQALYAHINNKTIKKKLLQKKKKRKGEKKRIWRQFCEWLSEAAACLPAAFSVLLLDALFLFT